MRGMKTSAGRRAHTARLLAASLLLSVVTQAARAEPAMVTNLPDARWDVMPPTGREGCELRSVLVGSPDYSAVIFGRAIGRRELSLQITASLRAGGRGTAMVGYAIGKRPAAKMTIATGANPQGQFAATYRFEGEEAAAIYRGEPLLTSLASDSVIVIDFGDIAEPLDSADACARERWIDAGVDPALVARIAVEPLGSIDGIDGIFSDRDYPVEAIRSGESGSVRVLTMIGVDGRAHKCRPLSAPRSPVLIRDTCAVIEDRARLQPARDKEGKAMEAPFLATVTWAFPPE